MKSKAKPPARRARLDTTTVVQAAVELIEAEGLEALTLGRLAKDLEVQTPSLYNHVDGLQGLMRELGAAAMLAVAEAYRAYVKEHYGLYLTGLRSAGLQTPVDAELQAAQERVVRIALAVVGSFGLQDKDALHAVRGLRSIVHGFATLEVAGGFGLPLDCDESFRRLIELFTRSLSAGEPAR